KALVRRVRCLVRVRARRSDGPAPNLVPPGAIPPRKVFMRLAVPKENAPGETRVAMVGDTVKRLVAKKVDVSIETHAGEKSFVRDDDYRAAGATIEPSADAMFAKADLVVQIHPPTQAQIGKLREGSALISLLYPLSAPDIVRALA